MVLRTHSMTAARLASVAGPDGRGGNPWLPWVPPLRRAPAPDRGYIRVVIPTAGCDLEMLARCLGSLTRAGEGTAYQVEVIVCPATPAVLRGVRKLCRGEQVTGLEGPFSYPRSINAGTLRATKKAPGYVLLLNDDTEWVGSGGLGRLKATLREENWAAVGPWLRQPDTARWERDRQDGPRRLNAPIQGACVLWEREWLERVGPFDLRFGEGYGFDESDQHRCALRLGATWGREERVVVEHRQHATFGELVDRAGEFYRSNLARWQGKWGSVGTWGEGVEWQPLPGVQVVVAGHDVAPWLQRCLTSVETALSGFRWVLLYADDGSTDGSAVIAERHGARSWADAVVIGCYPKAATVGQAKNRGLGLGLSLREQYPAVCQVDADDEMAPDRVRGILSRLRDGGHLAMHGDLVHVGGSQDGQVLRANPNQQREGWVSFCTMLFHTSLIPPDGRLYYEGLPAADDSELALRWHLAGIHSQPAPGVLCHRYYHREGSVAHQPPEVQARNLALWQARRAELLAAAGVTG